MSRLYWMYKPERSLANFFENTGQSKMTDRDLRKSIKILDVWQPYTNNCLCETFHTNYKLAIFLISLLVGLCLLYVIWTDPSVSESVPGVNCRWSASLQVYLKQLWKNKNENESLLLKTDCSGSLRDTTSLCLLLGKVTVWSQPLEMSAARFTPDWSAFTDGVNPTAVNNAGNRTFLNANRHFTPHELYSLGTTPCYRILWTVYLFPLILVTIIILVTSWIK